MIDKRIRWIDEVRGMAIILVILGHVIGGVAVELGGGEDNILHILIYAFHMPLMFIVSGMVGQNQYSRTENFIKKISQLVVSLYIPYLLWGYFFGLRNISFTQEMKVLP